MVGEKKRAGQSQRPGLDFPWRRPGAFQEGRVRHRDLSATVEHWITVLRMDPDARYFQWLLQRVALISPAQIRAVSAGSFFYSALLLTEGIGLWFELRWAEYLTVIATSSFIPLEL